MSDKPPYPPAPPHVRTGYQVVEWALTEGFRKAQKEGRLLELLRGTASEAGKAEKKKP